MRNLLSFIVLLTFFGCGDGIERPPKPEDLISQDEMAEIMYDVYLLNSAKGVNKKILEENGIYPEKYVFEKYGIDSTQFAKSNDYYAYDIKTYESILQKIKEKIELKKTEYEALEKAEEEARKKKEDSLRKVRTKEKDSLLKINKLKPRKQSVDFD